jgi:hypothetical protein
MHKENFTALINSGKSLITEAGCGHLLIELGFSTLFIFMRMARFKNKMVTILNKSLLI